MIRLTKSLAAIGVSMAFALVSNVAAADPFTSNYIFGDSLSDQGNLADVYRHNFGTPPFVNDAFTNGPTAVAILSAGLGLDSRASLFPTGGLDIYHLGIAPGGTNYALAGATAGSLNNEGVPGANLTQQVGAFLLSHRTDIATSLFTVFIGGNDVRTAAHQGNTAYVSVGVQTELGAINTLVNAGARNFLVVNVPDVGLIPEFTQESPMGQAGLAHDDSILFNQLLAAGLAGFNSGLNLKLFDLYTANDNFVRNAASYGITNTTDACYTNTSAQIANPAAPATASAACGGIDPATGLAVKIDQFQYWDHIHPSAIVQAAFGRQLLAAEVPEPASIALMLAGLAGVVVMQRRRSTAVTPPRLA